MLPDLALRRPLLAAPDIPVGWRAPLLRLGLCWLALLAVFHRDWAAMADQWWNSSTYSHILLVPFILAWLVKLRLPQLAQLQPSVWWPGLVFMSGALALWLLGNISSTNLASQLGAVLMLQAALLTLLGPRMVAALLFPVCYMLFLVPFGDELVPPLQMVTAWITIFLTGLSGIPAVIEGVFIDTPAGLFEVAEACSGVKFLVAMVALGTLVAHVSFRSPWRRAAFMAVAIILPILANGVRAWGTIYIAQSQGIEFAAGFDHIFYGWVFFALVMGALLAMAWRFFDRSPEDPAIDAAALQKMPLLIALERLTMRPWLGFAAILALMAATIGWSAQARQVAAPMPGMIVLPQVAGWDRTDYAPQLWWEPRATGADHRLLGSYRDEDGRVVDVFYALYSAQEAGREAAGFGDGALVPDTEWRWLGPGAALEGGMGDRLQALGKIRRTSVTWYRSGTMLGGSKLRLKLANMADRLALREQPTMLLILSTEERAGTDPQAVIADFLTSTGPVGEWMDRIAQRP